MKLYTTRCWLFILTGFMLISACATKAEPAESINNTSIIVDGYALFIINITLANEVIQGLHQGRSVIIYYDASRATVNEQGQREVRAIAITSTFECGTSQGIAYFSDDWNYLGGSRHLDEHLAPFQVNILDYATVTKDGKPYHGNLTNRPLYIFYDLSITGYWTEDINTRVTNINRVYVLTDLNLYTKESRMQG
ncbi:MAG: hypothetical protein FWC95_08310 [Defluviitaleaceae bacterium]|nr:hypothetical protein [Defluviitaleaceae bacterium]